MKNQDLRIVATLALNAIEEHLSGTEIDWTYVIKLLKEALDEEKKVMPKMKLFDELIHTNGNAYIYIGKVGYRDLLAKKSNGELVIVTGLTKKKDGKIYWSSGSYMLPIDKYFNEKWGYEIRL